MAENEGLFSNLRFSDIFFPAAASIASAYNPYIGYGLNTGMAMFNTMADFQHGLRSYKMAREQQRKEEEAIAALREGTDAYAGYTEEQLGLARKYGNQQLTEDYKQVANAAQSMNPYYADLPMRFSDMVGEGKQLDPSAGMGEYLYNDPEYRAMDERLQLLKFGSSAASASPGSVASMIGGLGQQTHGAYLSKAAAQQAARTAEEQANSRARRKSLGRAESHKYELEKIDALTAADQERADISLNLVRRIAAVHDEFAQKDLMTAPIMELRELELKYYRLLPETTYMAEADRQQYKTEIDEQIRILKDVIAQRTGGVVPPPPPLLGEGDGTQGSLEADAILNATVGSAGGRVHP
jgi:hypothetical protein